MSPEPADRPGGKPFLAALGREPELWEADTRAFDRDGMRKLAAISCGWELGSPSRP